MDGNASCHRSGTVKIVSDYNVPQMSACNLVINPIENIIDSSYLGHRLIMAAVEIG